MAKNRSDKNPGGPTKIQVEFSVLTHLTACARYMFKTSSGVVPDDSILTCSEMDVISSSFLDEFDL